MLSDVVATRGFTNSKEKDHCVYVQTVSGHWVKASSRTSPSKQGREGARIEPDAKGCDLTALDLVPLCDERSSGRGVRDHIVENAHMVAINEHLLQANTMAKGS